MEYRRLFFLLDFFQDSHKLPKQIIINLIVKITKRNFIWTHGAI